MRFVRTHSLCAKCPLRDKHRVWGDGSLENGIVLIGEAPGEDEDTSGRPFVGRAGSFLNWGLMSAKINRYQTYLTNVVSCRPPRNDLMSLEGTQALECCMPGFLEELEELRKLGCKILVPLGNHALDALGIDTRITKARGSVYLWNEKPVLPTFHPSYIMRSQHKKRNDTETLHVSYKYVWIADLTKAHELASRDWSPPVEDFTMFPTLQQVREYVEELVSSEALVAVDIETSGEDIVVVGLADSSTRALSVPFLKSGGDRYWLDADELEVRAELNRVFANCKLMFQNALFDVGVLRRHGYAIDYSRIWHDTLILHHSISPELPHNLAFIVSVYGDTPYWKDTLSSRRGSILGLPDEELRRYNLRDCVVLHQVLPPMLRDQEELGTERVYREESIPLLAPIGEMIETGFTLDGKQLEKLKGRWKDEAIQLEQRLRKLGRLPEAFNLASDDEVRYFLFGVPPSKFSKLKDLREYDPTTAAGRVRRAGTKVHRDLLSLADIHARTKPLYIAPRGRTTDSGKASVDKQGLLSLTITLQNRLSQVEEYKHERFKAEAKAIRSLLEWLRLFSELRAVRKLVSTYTDYPVRADGRVHTQFIPFGTSTGRLSSRNPNLQNLPKKRLEARTPFVASPGCTLLSADYNNLEVRVLAYEANDLALIQTLTAGLNVHDENTRVLFGLAKSHPKFAYARRAAKVFMFGGLAYGGGDREIYEKVVLEVPELHLTFAAFKQAKARWFAEHEGYRTWASRIRREVVTDGSPNFRMARTFRGRVRQLTAREADIEKEALNTPIQGGAAHIINEAMIRIHARKSHLKAKLLVQVHDQLIYEVPLEELEALKAIVLEEMQRELQFYERRVSFPVDLELGANWGELHAAENTEAV